MSTNGPLTTAPTALSYLPDRPTPDSFGIMNSPPAPASADPTPQDTPKSWFTGDWPVLSTSHAIEKKLIPEPPARYGWHHVLDDPMDIDYLAASVLPPIFGNIKPSSQNSADVDPKVSVLPSISNNITQTPAFQAPASQAPVSRTQTPISQTPVSQTPPCQTPASQTLAPELSNRKMLLPSSIKTIAMRRLNIFSSSNDPTSTLQNVMAHMAKAS